MTRHTNPLGPRLLRDERGAALFAAILAMVVLSTIMIAYIILARNEIFISQFGKDETQAAFAAEAGANHGRLMLLQRLSTDLPNVVSATARATMKTWLQDTTKYKTTTPTGGANFIKDMLTGYSPTFAICNTVTGGCPDPSYSVVGAVADDRQVILTLTGTNPVYTARVIVSSIAPPVIQNGGNGATFNYAWRIESSGTSGRALQQYVVHDSAVATNTSGAFTISLNADFVQYAHFIDQMDNTQAWISFRHVYTGPVHTNTQYNILGNWPTAGQEGPTFRSAATQWDNQTRFNNNGSATTQAKDSTNADRPILGLAPGIVCSQIDCAGFTRNFDYDPTTTPTPVDKIPFPATGSTDRIAEINSALKASYVISFPSTVQAPTCTTGAGANCSPVLVANSVAKAASGTSVGNLDGGIYVNQRVYDMQLAADGANGQRIDIYLDATHRVRIAENRTASPMTTRVQRQCWTTTLGSACTTVALGTTWKPDPAYTGSPSLNDQTFTGVFSPSAGTDYGNIWINCTVASPCAVGGGTGAIGQASTTTLLGVRKDPSTTVTRAIDANTRLTIAADGDLYIAGHLNYTTDPRGADGFFSEPIPGDDSGTSADDNLDVQNVLGVVSWAGGIHISAAVTALSANLDATLPVGDAHRDGNLHVQGMVMAINVNSQSAPVGQFSFDDPSGSYRGKAMLLGGVVQKTMGTFGSPGSPGTGYARDWTYDERFRYRGLAPPNFPGFPKFTAATSLGIDSYSWRLGLF